MQNRYKVCTIVKLFIVMEEQKKKYLLSRIRKEELIIETEFGQFRKLYQTKQILEPRNESYLQLISHLVELNNTFAAELIEYLEKSQIKDIFQRFNAIFNDLLTKYKQTYKNWKQLDDAKDLKQTRNICQICHEEIENNRIESIRQQIDRESEARSILIKNLIEETEKERVRPLFTEEEDRHFKQQLEKVLKKKEIALQINISQSNIFLEKIATEIASFMLEFRSDFGQWKVEPAEEGVNWPKMMKNYVNQKLTHSFEAKIPNWIRKMHDVFVENQPKQPKIYKCNYAIQTIEYPSPGEMKARSEIEALKKKFHANNEVIAMLEVQKQKLSQSNQLLKDELMNLKALLAQTKSELLDLKASQQMIDYKKESKENILTVKQLSTLKVIQNNKPSLKSMKVALKLSKMLSDEKSHSRMNTEDIAESIFEKSRKELSENQANEDDGLSSLLQGKTKMERVITQENTSSIENGKKLKKKVYRGNMRQQVISTKPDETKIKHKKSEVVASGSKTKETRNVSEVVSNKNQSNVKLSANEPSSSKKINQISKNRNESDSRAINLIDSKKSNNKLYEGRQMWQVAIQTQLKYDSSHQSKKLRIKETSSDVFYKIREQLSKAKEELTSLSKEKQSSTNALRALYKLIEEQISLESFNLDQKKDSPKKSTFTLQQISNALKQNHQTLKQQLESINKHNNEENQQILGQRQARGSINGINEIYKQEKMIKMPRILNKREVQNDSISPEERKNKSLCLPYSSGKNKKQKKLKLPQLSIHNESHRNLDKEVTRDGPKSSRLKGMLGNHYKLLFLEDKFAQHYEESFRESSNKKESTKPTPSQLQIIEEMFAQLQALKKSKKNLYSHIGVFLRYPFTEAKNSFISNNLAKNLTFEDFVNYFLKILWIHRNCPKAEHQSFCIHIDDYSNAIKVMSQTQRFD